MGAPSSCPAVLNKMVMVARSPGGNGYSRSCLLPHLPGRSRAGAAWAGQHLRWPGTRVLGAADKGRGALGLAKAPAGLPQAWPHGHLPQPRPGPAQAGLCPRAPLPHCRKSPFQEAPSLPLSWALSPSWGHVSRGGGHPSSAGAHWGLHVHSGLVQYGPRTQSSVGVTGRELGVRERSWRCRGSLAQAWAEGAFVRRRRQASSAWG